MERNVQRKLNKLKPTMKSAGEAYNQILNRLHRQRLILEVNDPPDRSKYDDEIRDCNEQLDYIRQRIPNIEQIIEDHNSNTRGTF